MYVLANMWFEKLIREFCFAIDKVVYGFIPTIYNLLIDIARTSVFSQSDILEIYTRIYTLLAVFMVFKVTFSLIMYVVNPDDFSDKGKGISKLTMNIIISLSLLILTPYIFKYAYELQSIVLEDNSLAHVIFGDDGETNPINTAGEDMAFLILKPFFMPNTGITIMQDCTTLMNGSEANESCTGLDNIELSPIEDDSSMYSLTNEATSDNDTPNTAFPLNDLEAYVYGLNNKKLSLMFRKNLVTASGQKIDFMEEITEEDDKSPYSEDEYFIMNYRMFFSTAVGVVALLLLLSFCMDVGIRSIKLGFLQLIAPIPILSYVDPKSGKDGLFKKWYEMCFKTFLSLFVRLFALYFAIYVISKVADLNLVDSVDGSYVTSPWIVIFIIIGALMFAKQFPKMLEGMGVKLDGDGKFNLNPFKKLEDDALGGKRLTGAASGLAIGALGNRNPLRALGGAIRGFAGNQGFSASAQHQANVNRQLRQAKLEGSTLGGRMNARWTNLTGAKGFNNVEKERKHIEKLNNLADAASKIEDRAINKITNGEAGDLSRDYLAKKSIAEKLQQDLSKKGTAFYTSKDGTNLTGAQAVAQAQIDANDYLNNEAKETYINRALNNKNFDGAMTSQLADYAAYAKSAGKAVKSTARELHDQISETKGEITKLDVSTRKTDKANKADKDFVEAAKIKRK